MKKSLLFPFLLSLTILTNAQVNNASQNLKQQASKMGTAFLKGDYTTFAAYIYPSVLKSMGGTANTAATLAKGTKDMKAKGIIFSDISFDEPTKLIKAGNQWQSTIGQHTKIKVPNGGLHVTSTLIAISTDNGQHWTFIDTSNKDINTIRKVLPDLSPLITIPPQQPPVKF